MRRTRFISPITYGITYHDDAKEEKVDFNNIKRKTNRLLRHFDTSLVTSELMAEQNLIILDELLHDKSKKCKK